MSDTEKQIIELLNEEEVVSVDIGYDGLSIVTQTKEITIGAYGEIGVSIKNK